MTDEQVIALAIGGAATAIGGAIKWAAGRIAKSQDDNGSRWERVVERNSNVMLENTTSNAVLSADIRQVVQILRPAAQPPAPPPAPVDASPEDLGFEITTVTTTTKRTPAVGTPVTHMRPATQGGER